MNERHDGQHDDPVELNATLHLDPAERATAMAVRRSLSDDAGWTTARAHDVASAARARASRRRRQRLMRTTAGMLGGAAAAATVAFSAPQFLSPSNAGQVAASSSKPAQPEEVDMTLVTITEVQAILPGAQLVEHVSSQDGETTLDACETGELAGPARPLSASSESWAHSQDRTGPSEGATASEARSDGTLTVTMDTYENTDQAVAYAEALERSVQSCTPQPGTAGPRYPFNTMVRLASALYVSDYKDGMLDVTAVQVTGRHVVTVNGVLPVPVAAEAEAGTLARLPMSPVPGADRKSVDAAVMSTVDLATNAADRVDP